jgi:hypothetical protein
MREEKSTKENKKYRKKKLNKGSFFSTTIRVLGQRNQKNSRGYGHWVMNPQ